jgi:hypothetical protein
VYAGEVPKPEKESWLFNTRKGSFSDIGRSFGAVFGASTGWDVEPRDVDVADVVFTPEMEQKVPFFEGNPLFFEKAFLGARRRRLDGRVHLRVQVEGRARDAAGAKGAWVRKTRLL